MSFNCPYCEAEINDPDDCYNQDTVYEHQCPECEKNFVFTLDYSVHYYPDKADCLNGSPHDYQKIHGWPTEYFINRRRCSMCDDKITLKAGDEGYQEVVK